MSKIKELKEQILKMFGTDNLFNYHHQILDDLEDAVREDEKSKNKNEYKVGDCGDESLFKADHTMTKEKVYGKTEPCFQCKGTGCFSSGSNVMIVNCPFCEKGRSLSSIQKSMRKK